MGWLSKGLLGWLSKGLLGGLLEGRLQWLLLGLRSLLELEGWVWLLRLLRDEGGGWLGKGWSCWLGGEQLGVGGISRVQERVHAGTVGTGGDRGGIWDCLLCLDCSLLELLSLYWGLLELLSLDWGLLELLSLGWSLLELLPLSWDLLSGSWSGSKLGSIYVGLEIQMRWISWVDEWIKVAAWNLWLRLRQKLLSLLGGSDRSDLSGLGGDGSSLRLLR